MSGETHCIRFRSRSRVIVLREDFLTICEGNHCAALVLSQMMYWYEVRAAHAAQAAIANHLSRAIGEPPTQDESAWVYKTRADLQQELMAAHGNSAVASALAYLVRRGYLRERDNPINRWDRTKQYLFDVGAVQAAVDALEPVQIAEDKAPIPPTAPRSRTAASEPSNEALKLTPRCTNALTIEALEITDQSAQNQRVYTETKARDYIQEITAADSVGASVSVDGRSAVAAAAHNGYRHKGEAEAQSGSDAVEEALEALTLRVTTITQSAKTAQEIIQRYGVDVVTRQLGFWPVRGKNAKTPGALFRRACEEDWPAPVAAPPRHAAPRPKMDGCGVTIVSTAPPARSEAASTPQMPPCVTSTQETERESLALEDAENARLDALIAAMPEQEREKLTAEATERTRALGQCWRVWLSETLVIDPDTGHKRVPRAALVRQIEAQKRAIMKEKQA